jgi:hypothetical protein
MVVKSTSAATGVPVCWDDKPVLQASQEGTFGDMGGQLPDVWRCCCLN